MINKIFLALCLISPSVAMAAPEIKGSPEEVEQYLSNIPKLISITESADKIAVSKQARMSLLVNTGAKKLSKALQENYDVRSSLRKQLNDLGVKDASIDESKFSSTPEYGMFGDEPKAYGVSNVVSVLLSSEQQMISIANIADGNLHIRYLSTKPMVLEKEKIEKELLDQAMQKAKAKAAKFQRDLGVTLIPVNIIESTTGLFNESVVDQRRKEKLVSSSYNVKRDVFGSKKLSVAVTIQYKLISN